MRIVNLLQRSPEWLQWRNEGVTASETPIILGRSPYTTPWRLWAEKTGLVLSEDLSGNPHVQRGIALEPRAREAFEARHDDLILPICAEADHQPRLRASFDGISNAGEPVELKCPSRKVFEEVRQQGEHSTAYALYWVQVQHQILVAGSQRGWLVFYHQGELLEFEVTADKAFLVELETKAMAFWEQVVTRKEPPKNPERDCFVPRGESEYRWTALVRQYLDAHTQGSNLDGQLQQVRTDLKRIQDQLLAMMGNYAQADYAGLRIVRYLTTGAVDYRQLLVEHLGELEEAALAPYRKQATERVRVTVVAPPLASSDTPTTLPLLPRQEEPILLPGQQPGSLYF